MGTLTIRGVAFGAGRAKLAVPLTGATREDLLRQAAAAAASPAELVEWRADRYADVSAPDALLGTLERLRGALGELPLLFTLRSAREGGGFGGDAAQYRALNETVAASGLADLIDAELSLGADAAREHVAALRAHAAVVCSHHDTRATPSRAQMLALLCAARETGADIVKLAVTARSGADVLALLDASARLRELYPGQPVIAVSMGDRGRLSRVACALSGSCVTFGALGEASAPGQLPAEELRRLLDFFDP